MGLWENLRSALWHTGPAGSGPLEEARFLDVPSGSNYRDLGGYPTPSGLTRYRRFVRAGATDSLTTSDVSRLERYGIRRVVDLRSAFEAPITTDRFARRPDVSWLNVPLFDYDLSDPALVATRAPEGNYLIDGYVTMLSNRRAVCQIFEFFGQAAAAGEGVLFHCAAGMDRTGVTAMLLLGLAEVPRAHIVADYLYSFATQDEVDRMVFDHEDPRVVEASWNPLPVRREAIEFVYDRVTEGYGTTRAYLAACGISEVCLDAVRGMLVES